MHSSFLCTVYHMMSGPFSRHIVQCDDLLMSRCSQTHGEATGGLHMHHFQVQPDNVLYYSACAAMRNKPIRRFTGTQRDFIEFDLSAPAKKRIYAGVISTPIPV